MSIGIDKTRSEERQAEINRQIEEFLKQGNKITYLPPGVSIRTPKARGELALFQEIAVDGLIMNSAHMMLH